MHPCRKDTIVGVNREQDKYFVRFYDFLDDLIQFNVLVIGSTGEKISHRLTSTLLRPYRLPELIEALEVAGLKTIDTFGDMNFSPFEPEKSANLVVVAKGA